MNWIFRSAKSTAVELNEEVGDEKHCKAIPMASRMAKLKIALQKHINLPPGTCETETYLVCRKCIQSLNWIFCCLMQAKWMTGSYVLITKQQYSTLKTFNLINSS